MKYIKIEVVFHNPYEAFNVGALLRDERLAADVQIIEIDSVQGISVIDGEPMTSKEYLLRATTRAKLYSECQRLIQENYEPDLPFAEPHIIGFGLYYCNNYFNWVDNNTKKDDDCNQMF